MLMAHPTVLRTLVDRYETLHALAGRSGAGETGEAHGCESVDPHIRQQLQDTVYTLCVSTGTRDVAAALAAAREHMESSVFAESSVPQSTVPQSAAA
ncbi:DUF5133 domain-containing protein [Streptomyces sp. NBC_01476]|uniref:DUF5133 domain-containing protein n=1 Tax=Streptomyces sp. NBC_01476 TaxID=2903881 RepID=UPI002E304EEB|nr:DUF5133 domain-containing protein [Streptomyces sp. NBC_01476]